MDMLQGRECLLLFLPETFVPHVLWVYLKLFISLMGKLFAPIQNIETLPPLER